MSDVLDEICGGALDARMEDVARRRDDAWDRYGAGYANYLEQQEKGTKADRDAAVIATAAARSEWHQLHHEYGTLEQTYPRPRPRLGRRKR